MAMHSVFQKLMHEPSSNEGEPAMSFFVPDGEQTFPPNEFYRCNLPVARRYSVS